MVAWILWAAGLCVSLFAIVVIWAAVGEDRLDPHSQVCAFFPALCGFAVFPVLNLIIGILMLIAFYDTAKPKGDS